MAPQVDVGQSSAARPEFREGSHNDVKIEEYDSELASARRSRSDSIKFVKLKQDVMFENPETPMLKNLLKDRSKIVAPQKSGFSLALAKAKSKESEPEDQFVSNGANQNAPARPSKFKRKTVKKSSGFPINNDDATQNKLKEVKENSKENLEDKNFYRMYSPQHKKQRKLSANEDYFEGNNLERMDSIGSRKLVL